MVAAQAAVVPISVLAATAGSSVLADAPQTSEVSAEAEREPRVRVRGEPRSGTSRKAARKEVELDVVASGDLLPHGPIVRAAFESTTGRYDFRPMFRAIRPVVRRAALALCHVETPIGAGAPAGYPRFNAPAALAEAIRWAGWDVCSTASNHSVDQGAAGIASTLRLLARADVRATGTARTKAEARRVLVVKLRGVKIAVLAYTYGTNGLPLSAPWAVNLVSRARIVRDAARARRRGADLVLVNLHWGDEYAHPPSEEQRSLARYLLRRGAVDAIVGQHAHVVQPIRRLFGRFVVFGEGNLLSAQTAACCPPETQDGLIAILRVRVRQGEARVARVDYVPTRVRHPDFVVEDVGAALRRLVARGEGASARAAELRESYRRTVRYAGRAPFIGPLPRRLPRR